MSDIRLALVDDPKFEYQDEIAGLNDVDSEKCRAASQNNVYDEPEENLREGNPFGDTADNALNQQENISFNNTKTNIPRQSLAIPSPSKLPKE